MCVCMCVIGLLAWADTRMFTTIKKHNRPIEEQKRPIKKPMRPSKEQKRSIKKPMRPSKKKKRPSKAPRGPVTHIYYDTLLEQKCRYLHTLNKP